MRVHALLLGLLLLLPTARALTPHCRPSGPYQRPLLVEPPLRPPPHRFIAFLLPVHQHDPRQPDHCGRLSSHMVLAVEALSYVKRSLGNRLRGLEEVGLVVVDTCGFVDSAIRDLVNFETCTLAYGGDATPVSPDQVIAYVTAGDGNFNEKLRAALAAFRKPVISLGQLSLDIHFPAPLLPPSTESEHLAKALTATLRHYTVRYLSIVYSNSPFATLILRHLKTMLGEQQICTELFSLPETANATLAGVVVQSLAAKADTRVLLLLTLPRTTGDLVRAATALGRQWHWLLPAISAPQTPPLPNSSLVFVHDFLFPGFRSYVRQKELSPSVGNPWLRELLGCGDAEGSACSQQLHQFSTDFWQLRSDVIRSAMNVFDLLALASNGSFISPQSLRSAHRYLAADRPSPANYSLLLPGSKGLERLAWADAESGLNLVVPPPRLFRNNSVPVLCLQSPILPPSSLLLPVLRQEVRAVRVSVLHGHGHPQGLHRPRLAGDRQSPQRSPLFHLRSLLNSDKWEVKVWAYVLTSANILLTVVIAFYQLVTMGKICRRYPSVSAKTLDLGLEECEVEVNRLAKYGVVVSQVILAGIVMLCLGSVLSSFQPSVLLCSTKSFASSISLTLCLGGLLTKLLVLLSAKQSQVLSGVYQVLFMLLLILIQGTISVQILLSTLAGAPSDASSDVDRRCLDSLLDYLKAYGFPAGLLVLSCGMGLCMRQNPFNHYEASFIASLTGFLTVLWASFLLMVVVSKGKSGLDAGGLGFAEWLSAAVVFLALFLPAKRRNIVIGASNIFSGFVRPITLDEMEARKDSQGLGKRMTLGSQSVSAISAGNQLSEASELHSSDDQSMWPPPPRVTQHNGSDTLDHPAAPYHNHHQKRRARSSIRSHVLPSEAESSGSESQYHNGAGTVRSIEPERRRRLPRTYQEPSPIIDIPGGYLLVPRSHMNAGYAEPRKYSSRRGSDWAGGGWGGGRGPGSEWLSKSQSYGDLRQGQRRTRRSLPARVQPVHHPSKSLTDLVDRHNGIRL